MSSKVSIGFTGDFCPWLRTEEAILKGNGVSQFESVLDYLNSTNYNVIDLEAPATHSITKIEKTGPHLKLIPESLELLKSLNCEIAATANNHFNDYGEKGIFDTLEKLKSLNIDSIGSGKNISEASSVLIKETNGLKLAYINITESEWSIATDFKAGCNPSDPVNIFNQILANKPIVDFIIVIYHGGNEHYHLPSPRIKNLFRFFIDSGAHAVVCHHTHVISGYEVYNGFPIFYGLGNFCFDWENFRNMPWNYGMILKINFKKEGKIDFDFEIIEQNNLEPGLSLLKGDVKNKKIEEINKLSQIIMDDQKLEFNFNQYCESKLREMDLWIQPYTGSLLPRLFIRKFLPSLITKSKNQLYTNLIRCESLREVLLYSLLKKIKK
jgi:poly-gamma-glutamate capsule biosynthesis protein CapA/YwtB (metallophosphatase superfamily)